MTSNQSAVIETKISVFISYSRADSRFVDTLDAALTARGYEVRIDRSSIEKGEEWWKRIVDLIIASTLVVFVISPNSLASPVCKDEVDLTKRLGKRIVPLMWRNAPGLMMPQSLSERDWVSFEGTYFIDAPTSPAFAAALSKLDQAIKVDDVIWARELAQWLKRAIDWDNTGRPEGMVMRAGEITGAQLWAGRKPLGTLPIPEVVKEFIDASVAKEARDREALNDRERRIAYGLQRVVGLYARVARENFRPDIAMRLALAGEPTEAQTAMGIKAEPVRRAELAAAAHSARCLSRLWGHSDSILSAAFSPDGQRVLTRSRDHSVRLWDADGGVELARFVHSTWVTESRFSADGSRVLTASEDQTARIWDAQNGPELGRLEHDSPVVDAAFSYDGLRVLTLSRDKLARIGDGKSGTDVRLWATDNGDMLTHLRDENVRGVFSPDGSRVFVLGTMARLLDAISGAELARHASGDTAGRKIFSPKTIFSPDGTRLLTVSEKNIFVRDARSGVLICRRQFDGSHICTIFSPDSQRVVTVSRNAWAAIGNFAILWAADTGADLVRFAHQAWVTSAAFNQEGTRLATASDRTVRVWDVGSATELVRLFHDAVVDTAVFSPDGHRVLTRSQDRTARLWETDSGAEFARFVHDGEVESAIFCPNGKRVLTLSHDVTAHVWDACSRPELARLVHDDWVLSTSFNCDGARILTVSRYRSAHVWDGDRGAEIARLAHTGIMSATFSPDGSRVLTASDDKTARLWSSSSGVELACLNHGERVTSAAFSPEGRRIVTVSSRPTHPLDSERLRNDQCEVRLWDAESGAQVAHLLRGERVASASFSPDGSRVLTASYDKTARVWDVVNGVELVRFVHEAALSAATFNSDGSCVLTASHDGTARLWDALSGTELARLNHEGMVHFATFSPDGTRVLTVSGNGARVWDVVSGAECGRLNHEAMVRAATFSPDGLRVLTASDDSTARVWDAESGVELTRLVHNAGLTTAIFSADRARVLTGSQDGTARIWDMTWLARLTGDRLVRAVARARLASDGRLTADEQSTLRPILGEVEPDTVSRWLAPSTDDVEIETVLAHWRGHRGMATKLGLGTHSPAHGDRQAVPIKLQWS